MRQCLTSLDGGYYTTGRGHADQFGQKGDFTTSPEISQIFGELVGIWFVTEWMAQGRPSRGIDLIELGPGRGTLMDDMLRTIRSFGDFTSAIENIYLVEASPTLRDTQKRVLCGDAAMQETSTGHQSRSKHSDKAVVWVDDLRSVPKQAQRSSFVVAHEFFDALPVHVFQSMASQGATPRAGGQPSSPTALWREMLVSHVIAPQARAEVSNTGLHIPPDESPEFELTLSKGATPHSAFLPRLSPRYRALESEQGAVIEISPTARSCAEEIALRIGGGKGSSQQKKAPAGAALIIDYGPSATVPVNSLRGIRAHRTVSPFSSAGLVDLSADVDFTALAEAAVGASPHVEVHGPVEQHHFLQAMGIRERAQQLLQRADGSDPDKVKRIDSGWKRLVDRAGMGKTYKAMAMVPLARDRRRPVGFGGDVVT